MRPIPNPICLNSKAIWSEMTISYFGIVPRGHVKAPASLVARLSPEDSGIHQALQVVPSASQAGAGRGRIDPGRGCEAFGTTAIFRFEIRVRGTSPRLCRTPVPRENLQKIFLLLPECLESHFSESGTTSKSNFVAYGLKTHMLVDQSHPQGRKAEAPVETCCLSVYYLFDVMMAGLK
jgi:hypothetical protein